MPSKHHGLASLRTVLDEHHRVLLITGPSRRYVEEVSQLLTGRQVFLFDQAQVHVPREVVDAALSEVDATQPEVLVAMGGGAAIGLAKAIRRERFLPFVAIPTTFSGSEMTSIYGVSHDGEKRTGRDPRTVADAVIYEPALTRSMPRGLAVKSALNAMAHPVAALASGSLEGNHKKDALRAIRLLAGAAPALAEMRGGGQEALEGAGLAGEALERGEMGWHHRTAHLLGGRFQMEHAGLHSVLLPHTLAHLRDEDPELFAELERAAQVEDLPATLFNLLKRTGAATSLEALGMSELEGLRDEEGFPLIEAAFTGWRPAAQVRRETIAGHDVHLLGDLEKCREVVVTLLDPTEVESVIGHDRSISIVAAGSAAAAQEVTAELQRQRGKKPAHVFLDDALKRIRSREKLTGGEKPLSGFGNTHSSESLPGALPPRQNSPQQVRYGLYAEQINATGFVAPRHENLRAWVYRIRPSAQHSPFTELVHPTFTAPWSSEADPNLMGWSPLPIPETPTDFVDGLVTFGGAGSARQRRGFAIHLYAANRSMEERAFYNADGELLLVPQLGGLTLLTEMGVLNLEPGHIALIPRGLRFSVLLHGGAARGYLAEAFGRRFTLPERGPAGANGLVDARHFKAPCAWHEDRISPGYRITAKYGDALHEARQDHSPYDVCAWHGNYAPYAYDLMDFSPISAARFDHPDPSLYTVLSAPLDEAGAHTLDFLFFPPRWDVSEETFRPPFFHRNATLEINGIIRDPQGDEPPFYAGGLFVTPPMTAHGVRARVVEHALRAGEQRPRRFTETSMWIQFESALPISYTAWARAPQNRVPEWASVWGAYKTHFKP